MNELVARTSAWLQSVLAQVPARIRALYVEYGDAFGPKMVHLVCFNAFGFESLAGGAFDPSNKDHVGELGSFTWEPPGECRFLADEHPEIDWMAVLKDAARTPEVTKLTVTSGLLLVVGEHDGDVFVIR